LPTPKTKSADSLKGRIKPRQARKDTAPDVEKFAFIIHPLDMGIVTRRYKIADRIPKRIVESMIKRKRPWAISEITGIKSKTGREAVGWFVVVPLLPNQILNLREKFVMKKIIKGAEVAAKLGAGIVGLGAFTALVGGAGKEIADASEIAVTTGNTYTVATAIEGAQKASAMMGIKMTQATVAVIGATGSIGRIAANILSREAGLTYIVGRNMARLEALQGELSGNVIATTDISAAVRQADVIVSVSSAVDAIINPADIKPGAVVCDVARPRDIAEVVAETRDDVLVIDGGVVKVPGTVDFHFDIGLPKGLALACMAETMILALEGRYEDYTIGREISAEQVREMQTLAAKHGFELAGFRSFEKALTNEQIRNIRRNAEIALRKNTVTLPT
jgi:fatty aldehyde-generating acyl-ACP reductase